MKRFLCFCALGLLAIAPALRAEDATGTTPLPSGGNPDPNPAAAAASRQDAEENYNLLKGKVDDLMTAQADLEKQIHELRTQLEELRAQASKSSGNYAGSDDLKKLADAIQEIDKKREADKDLILKEMEKLAQSISGPGTHIVIPRTSATNTGNSSSGGAPANPDQTGFYYTVKRDDTLGLIAQAYREQGIKVTIKQIEEANPNLNPAKLHVGMKIFIPAPKGSTLK